MEQTFGSFFKELRTRSRVTLRQFAIDNGLDPSNVSKLERGLLPAPRSHEKLSAYAIALGLTPDKPDWRTFFDLAAVSARTFSVAHIKSNEVLNKLPVLLRTIDNEDISPEELDRVIRFVEELESSDTLDTVESTEEEED